MRADLDQTSQFVSTGLGYWWSMILRDARILVDGGYRLTGVTPVDQFRHSAHVEIVAAFER